jgi:diaminohydroxyphosphoribosylaminopyrimidine deaminase/5-amino-6-(5-phosphoribosylamino)uracil reductase
MSKTSDVKYMRLALELAAKAKDRTYPNPMVGAVIVKNSKIVGKGYHRKAGEDHAEVRAIKDAGAECCGATMFVTLEPCDHYGKTPPCTQAIIKSGIKAVKIAMKDPNPLNNGRGIRKLRRAGISVKNVPCGEETAALNKKYIRFVTKGLPYVTLKLAQSVDGKIAARDGSSKWITSGASRKFVKKFRSDFDAIAVGINTVLKDDPLLLGKTGRGKRIKRVILDSRLRIPLDSRIIKTAAKHPVIIATTGLAPRSRVKKLRGMKGVDLVEVKSKEKKVPIRPFLRKLAQKGIVNLLVEGGGELAGSFLDEGMANEAMFFIAPKIIGGGFASVKGRGVRNIGSAVILNNIEMKRFGPDIFIKGTLCSRA